MCRRAPDSTASAAQQDVSEDVFQECADTRLCTQEYERRFGVWLDNLDFVHSHNQRGGSYWVRAASVCVLEEPHGGGFAWLELRL